MSGLATLVEETSIGGELIPYVPTTEISAIEAMTRAEIDMSISTAKRYPRMVSRSIASAKTLALSTPEVAQSCFYVLPARKGRDEFGQPFKPIIGPSVLALRDSGSNLGQHACCGPDHARGAEKFLIVQAVAQDMETNNTSASELRRSIWGGETADTRKA